MIFSKPAIDFLSPLGYRPRLLPNVQHCLCGADAGAVRVSLEITQNDWTVHCARCRSTGPALSDLREAVEAWNSAQHNTPAPPKNQTYRADTFYP